MSTNQIERKEKWTLFQSFPCIKPEQIPRTDLYIVSYKINK